VDMTKCIACGVCAEKCPTKVDNEYDARLAKRKSIHVKYSQAVPLKYAIDPVNRIFLTKEEIWGLPLTFDKSNRTFGSF
jgi:heterodisulfide reductase subunit A